MFNDHTQMIPPGVLLDGLSDEEYVAGGLSIPRNPKIAYVVFRLGLIEKIGTGLIRIKRAYQGNANQPQFSVSTNRLIMFLPLLESKPLNTTEDLSDNAVIIQKSLSVSQTITSKEVMTQTGLSRSQVIRGLKELQEAQVIERLGKGPATKYRRKLYI